MLLPVDVDVQRLAHQHAAGLGDRLDDQHARHHRMAGEVADEEGLVHRHALDADDRLVRHGSPRRGRSAGTAADAESAAGSPRSRYRSEALASATARFVMPPLPCPSGARAFGEPGHLAQELPDRHRRDAAPDLARRARRASRRRLPPAARRRRSSTWSASPTRRPSAPRRPSSRCPRGRSGRRSTQLRPITTLWAIWTRLSILVFSPITVSSQAPRSIQVLAPIATSSWMITRPSWGTSISPCGPTATPKPGLADHGAGADRHAVADQGEADRPRRRRSGSRVRSRRQGRSRHAARSRVPAPI